MKAHALKAFEMMAAAYPVWAEKFDDPMLDAWGSFVEDLPASELGTAITRLVRVCKFPPTVAEIHEMADRIRHEGRHGGRTIYDVMSDARKGGV